MEILLVLILGALISIATALWRLAYLYRDGVNQHIRAMEAMDQRLAEIQRAVQSERPRTNSP